MATSHLRRLNQFPFPPPSSPTYLPFVSSSSTSTYTSPQRKNVNQFLPLPSLPLHLTIHCISGKYTNTKIHTHKTQKYSSLPWYTTPPPLGAIHLYQPQIHEYKNTHTHTHTQNTKILLSTTPPPLGAIHLSERKYTNIEIHKYKNTHTEIQKYPSLLLHLPLGPYICLSCKYTNIEIHKYKNTHTKIQKYPSLLLHLPLGPYICLSVRQAGSSPEFSRPNKKSLGQVHNG